MTHLAKQQDELIMSSHSELQIEDVIPVIDDIIAQKQGERGSLIPVLQSTQNLLGYLPKPILVHISEKLEIPYSEVAGVVTFYSFFSTTPRGKHTIRVCMGTACYVRGGKEVLEALSKELKIGVGETTEDGLFSLEVGRCFGACGLAPVVMVDEDVHQRVKESQIKNLLEPYLEEGGEDDES
jgi:NADH:ubiquinone oxidoreductase subunit E